MKMRTDTIIAVITAAVVSVVLTLVVHYFAPAPRCPVVPNTLWNFVI